MQQEFFVRKTLDINVVHVVNFVLPVKFRLDRPEIRFHSCETHLGKSFGYLIGQESEEFDITHTFTLLRFCQKQNKVMQY